MTNCTNTSCDIHLKCKRYKLQTSIDNEIYWHYVPFIGTGRGLQCTEFILKEEP